MRFGNKNISIFTDNLLTDYQMWSTLRQAFQLQYVLTCSNEWRPLALPKRTMSSKMTFFSSFKITRKAVTIVTNNKTGRLIFHIQEMF